MENLLLLLSSRESLIFWSNWSKFICKLFFFSSRLLSRFLFLVSPSHQQKFSVCASTEGYEFIILSLQTLASFGSLSSPFLLSCWFTSKLYNQEQQSWNILREAHHHHTRTLAPIGSSAFGIRGQHLLSNDMEQRPMQRMPHHVCSLFLSLVRLFFIWSSLVCSC